MPGDSVTDHRLDGLEQSYKTMRDSVITLDRSYQRLVTAFEISNKNITEAVKNLSKTQQTLSNVVERHDERLDSHRWALRLGIGAIVTTVLTALIGAALALFPSTAAAADIACRPAAEIQAELKKMGLGQVGTSTLDNGAVAEYWARSSPDMLVIVEPGPDGTKCVRLSHTGKFRVDRSEVFGLIF